MLGDELFASVFATVVLSGIAFFSILCYTCAMAMWAVDGEGCLHIPIFLATLPTSYFLPHHRALNTWGKSPPYAHVSIRLYTKFLFD
jgi:hypothetical protein